jgi:hypothetical protein
MSHHTPQGHELHQDVSTLQRAGLIWTCLRCRGLSCTWTCLPYRGLHCIWKCLHHRCLSCTWPCLNHKARSAPETVYTTVQRPMLHLDVSTPQGPELYMGMSTIQRPVPVIFRFNPNSTNVISFKAISEKSNFLHRLNAFSTKSLLKNVW